MAEFSKQGTLSTLGTVLYTGTDSVGALSKIVSLRFNNPGAYDLKLAKVDYATSTVNTIYDLSLSAGDTLTDNLTYALNPGDQLIATSNIAGTTYYVYGIDYATNG
jgi:hypothetical protein